MRDTRLFISGYGFRMARPATILGITLTFALVGSPAEAQTPCGGIFNGQSIIYSPNFPLPAPSGQICQWTLKPATGKIGILYFFDFDVGPNSYLDIYKGTAVGTAADLLTTYTNRGPGEGIVTMTGPVTLQYRGAALQLNRGFTIAFFSVLPPPRSSTDDRFTGCGGQLTGAGTVTSPGHPGWYPINSICAWKLLPCEVGAEIKIEFSALNVEANFDRIDIYTGQADNLELFVTYTGNTLPQSISIKSPVTVVFESDNVNAGNSGFSLQFSTVSTTVAAADPLASPEACPGLCPASVQPDPTSYCYAHDDPHVKTFCDQGTYEFQYEGVYYMYKHKTAPISVQAAFQSCDAPNPSSVTCSCAVAVRYCDEVFVVDRCFHIGSTVRENKVYKAGSGTQMSITANGASFKVILPTGLTVDIGSSWKVIGTVDIRDSLGNKNMSWGLCDCQRSYRCSTSPSDYPTAGHSWGVRPEESLFTEWKQKIPCNIASCTACRKLPSYVLPNGVADAAQLQFGPGEYSDGTTFLFVKQTRGRQADAAGDRGALAFTPPWTQTLAQQHCMSQIGEHPAISLCQKTLSGNLQLTRTINDCVLDILLTGGSAFTRTALEGSKFNCLHTLNNAGLSNAAVLRLMCPNECSSHGTCENGICKCNNGWFGSDCSIDPSVPPVLRNSSGETSCTQNATLSGSCLIQKVYGQTFYNVTAGYPKCRIQSQAGSLNNIAAADTTIVQGEYVSAGVVICRLPAGKPGAAVGYVISISNNGVAYSNGVATSRYFSTGCGQPISESGTLNSPNYPSPYSSNASCTWTLTAAAGRVVQLLFNSFNVENGFDFVQVYDSGRLVDVFTGNLGAQPARPYGQSITVVFNSDASVVASGFSIAFTSVVPSVNCGGAAVGNAIISSPLYPDLYPNNAYCVWTLTPTGGLTARLHFTAFSLEAGRDYLRVYAAGTKVATYTGAALPADYSPGASPYLVFRSDAIIQQTGFSLRFTSV